MRRLPAFGALLLVCLSARNVFAGERWVEVRSPHFQVVANAGARSARHTAERLEKFRAAVDQVFPGQPLDDAVPTTVLVFKDAESFKPLFPVYQGKRVAVGGLFINGFDRNYMALDGSAGDEAYETVFHEYTHLLTSRLPLRLPVWVNEGVAELYSTAQVRAGEVALGRPLPAHILRLREHPLLPLETLFAVDHDSPYYNERDQQGIFYAQSWALVHYLLIHEAGRGRPLRPFLDALAAGASSAEACRTAFGVVPAVLQKELSAYVRRYRFPYHTAPVQPVPPGQLSESTLGAHERAFYVGDALVHANRLDEARPFLEEAIALQPAFAPSYRSMGLGYVLASDHATAVRWLGSAIERDPRDGVARLLRARATILAAGASFGPAAAAIAREDARMATVALPASTEAWLLLAHIDSVLGRRDDDALRVLREAVLRAPERHDLWSRLVHVLLARGEIGDAQGVAERLSARASTPEEKERADALLRLVAAALSAQRPEQRFPAVRK